MSGQGQAFGYFFGPRLGSKKEINANALSPEDAVLVGKFGDLELRRGNWPVVGNISPWVSEHWPMPPLARIDVQGDRAWLSLYDDKLDCIEEREIAPSEVSKYPCDRLMGAGSVEIRLTKLVGDTDD